MPSDNQSTHGRVSWDALWTSIAQRVAQRSYDPKYQVGAIVVTDDNTQMLALGYNGNYAGGPNRRESDETGKSGFIHAEINALLKLDYNHPSRKTMYITHSPCAQCAKAIVNAGIDEVVYAVRYSTNDGLDILVDAGIPTRRYYV